MLPSVLPVSYNVYSYDQCIKYSIHIDPIIITRAKSSEQDNPLILKEGEANTMNLIISASPKPVTTFMWFRNDEVLFTDNGLTLALDSITFNPAMREHSGMYRLIATNSAGTGEFNFTLDVLCE